MKTDEEADVGLEMEEQSQEATLADIIREDYLGFPLAILCARYWYRGIVKRVGKDFVTLSNAYAVEVTGASNASEPTTEDPIPSDLTISTGAVEQFCQPLWCWKDLDEFIKPPEHIKKAIEAAKKNKA